MNQPCPRARGYSRVWRIVALLVATVLAIGVSPVWGGGWTHTSHGPYGGVIPVLAVDTSNRVYAAAYQGWLYVSPDGGDSWNLSRSGIPNSRRNITALAAASDGCVFAGAERGGVYQTCNGGGTWTAKGTLANPVYSLLVDPNTPTTVYAGTSASGVYKWAEPGPWVPMNDGAPSASVLTLVTDSNDDLYLGSDSSSGYAGVYRWTFVGPDWEWQAINTGLPSNTTVQSLHAVGTNLWAGTKANGVYFWNGSTWAARNSGLSGDALQVHTVTADGTGELYAGTADGFYHWTGTTWELRDSGLEGNGLHIRDLIPTGASTLYAGTDGRGVYKTTDGGLGWSPKNSGLSGYLVRAVAINPQYDWRVYAGTFRGGIYWSPNGGLSWSWRSTGLGDQEVEALAVTFPSGTPVYAGLNGLGVYRSDNLGALWTEKSDGLSGNALYVNSLVIKPVEDAATVYAGTEDGVYWTTTAGDLWSKRSTGMDYAVAALAIDPRPGEEDTVYAGTSQNGVFRSLNEGASWTLLPGLSGDEARILSLAVDGTGKLYAGTVAGLYSYDGSSWASDGPATEIHALVTDPLSPTVVYAGSAEGTSPLGVLERTDVGWQPINAGLVNLNVYALTIDDYYTQTLHAGTGGSSVWDYTFGAEPPPLAPEVGVDLDDGISVVHPGDIVNYSVTYYNTGAVDAVNVAITMTLPNFTDYVSSHPEFVPLGDDQYRLITPVVPLETVFSADFTVQVKDAPPYPDTIVGVAEIMDDGSSGPDPYLFNNVEDDVDLLQLGDLAILKSATPESGTSVVAGQRITYELTIHNVGDTDLAGLVLTDVVPAEATYVPGSIWPTPEGDDGAAPTLNWQLGALTAGSVRTAGFAVTVDAVPVNTLVNNYATVSSNQTAAQDSNVVSHVVTHTVVVEGPDFVVDDITMTPASPEVGQPVGFQVTIRNQGSLDADREVWVELYIKPQPSSPPSEPGDHDQGYCLDDCSTTRPNYVELAPALAQGSTYVVPFGGPDILFPLEDDYDVYVQVDPYFEEAGSYPLWGRHAEEDEMNNIGHMEMSFSGPPIVYLPMIYKAFP